VITGKSYISNFAHGVQNTASTSVLCHRAKLVEILAVMLAMFCCCLGIHVMHNSTIVWKCDVIHKTRST